MIKINKIKITLVTVAIFSILFTGARIHASDPDSPGRLQPVKIEVSCQDFKFSNHMQKSVKIAKGGRLEIILCSNPSTGYNWPDSAQIHNHSVLWQTGHTTIPSNSSALGAPEKERWTFQGLREGTSHISLEYSRSWESGGSGNWSIDVKVQVVDEDKPGQEKSLLQRGESLVREFFQDIHNSNISGLQNKISRHFQGIHNFGATTKEQELRTIKDIKLEKYSLGNFQVTGDDDILVVTYTVEAEETIKGKEVPKKPIPRLSVFVRGENSNWKLIAHANLS